MRFCDRKYNKFLWLIILCLTSSTVFSANETPFLSTLKQGHFAFELGADQGTQGNPQHINIQGLVGDTFTVNNTHYFGALAGLGYFIDGKNLGRLNMSYGVNAFYLTPTSVSGNVILEDLFTNLSYHYNIVNYPVYVMAKSAINLQSPFVLTIDAGVGPNFMRTYDFNESSVDGGVTIPDKIFSGDTTTTFSATIGVSFKINNDIGKLPLEIGYRFLYLGQGYLKTRSDQVLNKFNTGNVYANAIFFSVSI
jgi:hypothetical protein